MLSKKCRLWHPGRYFFQIPNLQRPRLSLHFCSAVFPNIYSNYFVDVVFPMCFESMGGTSSGVLCFFFYSSIL
jgi:hypothetical protein